MKFLFIVLLCFATHIQAQKDLSFEKLFVESEDKWVAFPKAKDNTYPYGFIYIDASAGLTFNYEGNFTITDNGVFVPRKMDSTNVKVRLQPNNVRVAFIPKSKFEELKIAAIPEWLKYYKTDTTSTARLYRWGYLYNGWGQCAKALTYLQKAEQQEPNFKGLSVELAFSYNCLNQYDKAVTVLQKALTATPTDAYTNKELIYAQIKSGQLDKAAESCKKALVVCTDKTYNGENCYNLLHNYYEKKDKENFKTWLSETKKWTASSAELTRNVKLMEDDLLK